MHPPTKNNSSLISFFPSWTIIAVFKQKISVKCSILWHYFIQPQEGVWRTWSVLKFLPKPFLSTWYVRCIMKPVISWNDWNFQSFCKMTPSLTHLVKWLKVSCVLWNDWRAGYSATLFDCLFHSVTGILWKGVGGAAGEGSFSCSAFTAEDGSEFWT